MSDVTFEEDVNEFLRKKDADKRQRRGGIVGFLLRRHIVQNEASASFLMFIVAVVCFVLTVLLLLNVVFHINVLDLFTDSEEREQEAFERLPEDLQKHINRIRQ